MNALIDGANSPASIFAGTLKTTVKVCLKINGEVRRCDIQLYAYISPQGLSGI